MTKRSIFTTIAVALLSTTATMASTTASAQQCTGVMDKDKCAGIASEGLKAFGTEFMAQIPRDAKGQQLETLYILPKGQARTDVPGKTCKKVGEKQANGGTYAIWENCAPVSAAAKK